MFSNGNTIVKDWMRGLFNSETAVHKISLNTLVPYQIIMDELIVSAKSMKFNDTGIVDQIKSLRKAGVKVVIATDNMDTFKRWTVPAMELEQLFDDIIDSYSKKALKTDFIKGNNLFFKDYIKKSKIKPGESILIDDSENAAAVERLGIKFKHFERSRPLSSVFKDLGQ
jgi:FMN phosphatase YigB (HAD superfamily)